MTNGDDDRRSPIIGELRRSAQSGPGQPGHVTPPEPETPIDVIVEINAVYPGGVGSALQAFAALWQQATVRGLPDVSEPLPTGGLLTGVRRITASCLQSALTPSEAEQLIRLDRAAAAVADGPSVIFKIWPDYELEPLIDRSAPTVKVDAARRAFAALGAGIVWAVLDSGIDATHPHFAGLELSRENVGGAAPTVHTRGLHRDFTTYVIPSQPAPDPPSGPLFDELGHGTHVAGIIAGQCPDDGTKVQVASSDEPLDGEGFIPRTRTGQIAGMAPNCELVSLKVFRQVNGAWKTSASAVMAALEYLRTEVNVTPNAMRVHGVNLSLGCEWDPAHYAAGQSPLCQLVNRIVDSGVVVVVSAGNSGKAQAQSDANVSIAALGSITEPAHADACITVGSTHRDSPFTFGISWTSSKGPTLDGRCKPDVVAPGEWITSAATGTVRAKAGIPPLVVGSTPCAAYAEQSGTSMAAPHVSGVIAGFLSVRPEFIGRPRQVKDFVVGTAVDLGRERYAQGAGLVDAMGMLANC